MKNKVKKIISSINEYRYHYNHKKNALKILNTIEQEKGKLSDRTISQCDQYAKNYLGDIKYAPWLYVYSAIQGEFKKGWIPDNYYGLSIVRDIDKGYSQVSELKPLTSQILKTNLLPDLLYSNNRFLIEPKSNNIVSHKKAFDLLFNENDTVIFKANDSSQGKGVKLYNKDNWPSASGKLTNGVFQKIIKQHDFFNSIFPHPGATIRITTGLDSNGIARVRTAYLRLGRNNNNSLSTHVQSSNAIKIAINISTGELAPTGYLADWSSTKTHPDTNIAFEGLIVPAIKDAFLEVEKLHSLYPFVLAIGWDATINTDKKVEIMEWNTAHNDIKFSEAMHGPCFADILTHVIKTK